MYDRTKGTGVHELRIGAIAPWSRCLHVRYVTRRELVYRWLELTMWLPVALVSRRSTPSMRGT